MKVNLQLDLDIHQAKKSEDAKFSLKFLMNKSFLDYGRDIR